MASSGKPRRSRGRRPRQGSPDRRTYLIRRLVLVGGLIGLGIGTGFVLRRPAEGPPAAPRRADEPTLTSQAEVFASTLKTQEILVRYQHDHGGALPDDAQALGIEGAIGVVKLDRPLTDAGPAATDLVRLMGDRPGLVLIESAGPARGRVWGIGRNGKGEATVLVRLMPPVR